MSTDRAFAHRTILLWDCFANAIAMIFHGSDSSSSTLTQCACLTPAHAFSKCWLKNAREDLSGDSTGVEAQRLHLSAVNCRRRTERVVDQELTQGQHTCPLMTYRCRKVLDRKIPEAVFSELATSTAEHQAIDVRKAVTNGRLDAGSEAAADANRTRSKVAIAQVTAGRRFETRSDHAQCTA